VVPRDETLLSHDKTDAYRTQISTVAVENSVEKFGVNKLSY